MITFSTFVIIVGILMSSAYYIQAIKIFRKKSTKGVSSTTYFILIPGVLVWLIYGFQITDLPVIISNILNLIGCVLVLVAYYMYKDK